MTLYLCVHITSGKMRAFLSDGEACAWVNKQWNHESWRHLTVHATIDVDKG